MKKVLAFFTLFIFAFLAFGCETIKKSAYGINNVVETEELTEEQLKEELNKLTPIENENYISAYVYGKVMGADFYGNIDIDVKGNLASALLKIGAMGGLVEGGDAKVYIADHMVTYDANITIASFNYSGSEKFDFDFNEEGLNKMMKYVGLNYTHDFGSLLDNLESYTAGKDENGKIVIEFTYDGSNFRVVLNNNEIEFIGGTIDTKSEFKKITFNATLTYGSANVTNPF